MNTTFTRLALVLGLGILPLAAQPFGGGKGTHMGGPRMAQARGFQSQGFLMGRMAEQLKLTEAQKAQLQSIQKKHQEASTAKLQAAADARKAFQDAMRKPETSNAQLKSLYQAKSDRQFDLVLDRRAMHNELLAILTPEQKAELDKGQAYREARQAYGQGRRSKGGRGMGMGF